MSQIKTKVFLRSIRAAFKELEMQKRLRELEYGAEAGKLDKTIKTLVRKAG